MGKAAFSVISQFNTPPYTEKRGNSWCRFPFLFNTPRPRSGLVPYPQSIKITLRPRFSFFS